MASTRIGVIGVGQMGWHIARRLAEAGHEVAAYDPRQEVMDRLGEIGVQPAANAAGAARGADVVILMVLSAAQADDAVWGAGGAAEELGPDALLVVMSTLPPRYVRELAERASGSFRVIDAPVSGGVEGAAAGTLTVIVAGAADDVARFQDVAGAVGTVLVVGDRPGLGEAMKLVNNAMYYAAHVAAGEMLVAAAKAGLDPDQVVEVVGRSTGSSWALVNRAPLAWRADYTSGASLAIGAKDLAAALEFADDMGVDAQLIRAAEQHVLRAMDRFEGQGDDPRIVGEVEAASGFVIGRDGRRRSS